MTARVVHRAGPLLGACLLILAGPPEMIGQTTARITVAEENFRLEPRGRRLAVVLRGAEFPVTQERDQWVEVDLGGWIWAPSVSESDRDGFDLVVSADGGENLRIRPQGRIVARLLEGFLLERVGAGGNWVRVRRRGWIWKPSVELSGARPMTSNAGADPTAGDPGSTTDSADVGGVVVAPVPIVVYTRPDGDSVAVVQPGAQAQILGRSGDWIRVRVDGWVYGPAALDSLPDLADTGDLTPAQLRAEPARYKGALVRWRVQVISLRRAEPARTDFDEGEPFLLARGPGGDSGFVYLAVPENLVTVAESLDPLSRVTVVGRVRTGRSSLLGSPVIDLTDIEVPEPTG